MFEFLKTMEEAMFGIALYNGRNSHHAIVYIGMKNEQEGLTAMWKSDPLNRIAWNNCALFASCGRKTHGTEYYIRDG